jgi:hypothetical protein
MPELTPEPDSTGGESKKKKVTPCYWLVMEFHNMIKPDFLEAL